MAKKYDSHFVNAAIGMVNMEMSISQTEERAVFLHRLLLTRSKRMKITRSFGS